MLWHVAGVSEPLGLIMVLFSLLYCLFSPCYRSEGVTCGICLEVVKSKANPSEQRFGILSECISFLVVFIYWYLKFTPKRVKHEV